MKNLIGTIFHSNEKNVGLQISETVKNSVTTYWLSKMHKTKSNNNVNFHLKSLLYTIYKKFFKF